MQDVDGVAELRSALDEAQKLTLSKRRVFRRVCLPVSESTIFRWLAGEVDPGLARLAKTVKALKEFTVAERARLARGGNALAGPLSLDPEFSTASRGGVTIELKGQEFKILEALKDRSRPAYRDWICDTADLPEASFARAASELRRKLAELDFEMRTRPGRDGEPPAYYLADKAAKDAAVAA